MSNLFPRVLRTVSIVLLFAAAGRNLEAQTPPSMANSPSWSGPRMCLKVVEDTVDARVKDVLLWIRDRNTVASAWKGPYRYSITITNDPLEPSDIRYSGDLMKSDVNEREPEKLNQLKGLFTFRDRRNSLVLSIVIPRNPSYDPESDDHPCEPAGDSLEPGEPTPKPEGWN